MICPYCGASLRDGAAFCGNCGSALQGSPSIDQMMGDPGANMQGYSYPSDTDELGYFPENQQAMDFVPITVPKQMTNVEGRRRNKPSLLLRLPLQIISFFLSILLTVCLLATAVLMDCNRILSAGGIKAIMNAVFSVTQTHTPSVLIPGAVGAGVRMEETTMPPIMDIPADIELPSNIEMPADILTSGDAEALVDWLCNVASQMMGEEVAVDRQQLQSFVEQSTLTEYLAEKASGYASDFINGTQNTWITSEELMDLLEENEALIEGTFQVEFSREMKQELQAVLEQSIEESNLNEMIHEEMFTAMEETLNASLPVEWAKIQEILQMLLSGELMTSGLIACAVIMLLLCLLNFYNVPGGLTWSALPCIFVGAILSLPIALLQMSPAVFTEMLAIPGVVVHLVSSFLSAFSLVHYGILFFGVVLLVLSILWRILRAAARSTY